MEYITLDPKDLDIDIKIEGRFCFKCGAKLGLFLGMAEVSPGAFLCGECASNL